MIEFFPYYRETNLKLATSLLSARNKTHGTVANSYKKQSLFFTDFHCILTVFQEKIHEQYPPI
jgi:hypothetical protein